MHKIIEGGSQRLLFNKKEEDISCNLRISTERPGQSGLDASCVRFTKIWDYFSTNQEILFVATCVRYNFFKTVSRTFKSQTNCCCSACLLTHLSMHSFAAEVTAHISINKSE